MAGRGDEHRHTPGPEPLWCESWGYTFAALDGSFGGFVRLQLWPNLDAAWCWAAFARRGEQVLVVRDQEVRPPRGAAREVRADGLWVELDPLTPLEHWSVGLEAFASGYDDPAEGWGDERGDRVPLGFELSVEARSAPVDFPGGTRYAVPCTMHGEVLIADERLDIEVPGVADHRWAVADWWSHPPTAATGALDDGAIIDLSAAEGGGAGWGWMHLPESERSESFICSIVADDADSDFDARPAASIVELLVVPQVDVSLQARSPTGDIALLVTTLSGIDSSDGSSGAGWLTRPASPAADPRSAATRPSVRARLGP